MKRWFFVTLLFSANIGAIVWHYTEPKDWFAFGAGVGAFLVSFIPCSYVAIPVCFGMEMTTNQEMRNKYYEYKLAMKEHYRPVPRFEQPKEPVIVNAWVGKDEASRAAFPDIAELVRLAKILKAANYRIRARDLMSDFASVRNAFSQIAGMTTEQNGVVDLTDEGIRLVNDLDNLSPSQVESTPLHVLRRVTQR